MRELSVLMPVYNAAPFLDESIQSIFNQSYTDFEFIILDDSSTDNSLKIIQFYAKKDNRIKVLQNKQNKKEAACRNILLKSTKTEFIAWIDADDISSSDRLQTQLAFLKNNPKIDIVGSQIKIFGITSSIINYYPLSDHEIKSYLLLKDFLAGASTMLRLKKIRKYKVLYNEKLPSAADLQFWVDCLPFVNFANIDKVLYKYRTHPQQDTTANKKINQACHLDIIERHLLKFEIKVSKKILNSIIFDEIDYHLTCNSDSILKILEKIIKIKPYYKYHSLHKSFLNCVIECIYIYKLRISKNLNDPLNLLKKYLKENPNLDEKIVMEMFFKAIIRNAQLKDIVSFLKNCDIPKKEILKIFYRIIIKKIKNNFKKL